MNNLRSLAIIGLILIILSGCVTANYSGITNSVPVRDFSYKNKPYEDGFGMYGYVLLTKPVNDTSLLRKNTNFFYSYINNLPKSDSYTQISRSNLMVTYWLTNKNYSSSKKELLSLMSYNDGYYDYDRANIMLSAIKLLDKQGPILVAWKQPFEKVKDFNECLTLDLTNYSSDDMNRALLLWRQMLVDNGSTWEIAVLKFREGMRNLLQKYGGTLSDAITKKT